MIGTLERERDRMTERIECLIRNRDAIADYLNTVRSNKSADTTSEVSATS